MKRLGLILVLLFVASAADAATRYVSDQLEITLRSGPTNQHRILRMLPSGTRLETLETTEDGWTRVRAANGQEGWVLTRYLMNTPAARDRLEQATANLSNAQTQTAKLREALNAERAERKAAEAQIAELSTANQQMISQLEEAAQGLRLSEENKSLKKEIVDLQRTVQELNNEIDRLSDRSRRDWFVAGALVVAGGFLAGIIVTRIRWRRKSSWNSL